LTEAGYKSGAANLAAMDRAEAEAIYDSGRRACVKVLLALGNQVSDRRRRRLRMEEGATERGRRVMETLMATGHDLGRDLQLDSTSKPRVRSG